MYRSPWKCMLPRRSQGYVARRLLVHSRNRPLLETVMQWERSSAHRRCSRYWHLSCGVWQVARCGRQYDLDSIDVTRDTSFQTTRNSCTETVTAS